MSAQQEREAEIVLGKFAVTLGGETVFIEEKPLEAMVEFRTKTGEVLGSLASVFSPLLSPMVEAQKDKVEDEDEAEKPALGVEKIIAEGLTRGLPVLMGPGADLLIECLVLYAPELEETIAKATYSEKVAAGMEVYRIASPLAQATLTGLFRMIVETTDGETKPE